MSVKNTIASIAEYRKRVIENKDARITVDRYGIPIVRTGMMPHARRELRRQDEVSEEPSAPVIDVDVLADKVAARLRGSQPQPQAAIDTNKLLSEIKDIVSGATGIAKTGGNDIITPVALDEPTTFVSTKTFDSKIQVKAAETKSSLDNSELDKLFDIFNTGGNNE